MSIAEQAQRRAKWQTLIEEHEKSGQTQIEFCQQRQVSSSQMSYYRGIFKAKTLSATSENLFSSIHLTKPALNTSTEMRIVLPNGFQCFLPSSIDKAHIKNVVEVLLSC